MFPATTTRSGEAVTAEEKVNKMARFSSLSYAPYVNDDGIWSQQIRPMGGEARPALFLDRDGVIVDEVGYLHRPGDVHLSQGVVEVIQTANKRDVFVIIVTNQSGIGRGKYGWAEFSVVQETILNALRDQKAYIDAVYACPFHGEGKGPWKVKDHPDRKPRPGMLVRAANTFPIDIKDSWIIGDRAADINAGKNAGLAGGVQLLSGHGSKEEEYSKTLKLADHNFLVHVCEDMRFAIKVCPLLC